jgi:preprotein translocase subunit YajC
MNQTILISILFALVAIMFVLIFLVIYKINKIFKSYDNNLESLNKKTAKLID